MEPKDSWEEGLDEEIAGKLMELRTYLGTRVKELEEELDKLKALSSILDEVIVSKSFRRAETISTTAPEAQLSTTEAIEAIPLKTAQGVILAEMFVALGNIRIVPVTDIRFKASIPPFQSFFVSRILESMRIKDDEEVQLGKRLPETAMIYDIVTDAEVIQEIVIRNYGSERRLQEIKSAGRWTLEKMYERITQT